MTTKPPTTRAFLPLPDPPEREPDDMTSVQHLGENGNLHHLVQYLGNPETTIVSGERYIVPVPGTPSNQRIAPDMLISFNSDPALYRQDNGYVISRQGKPPDLVMEIASERTGKNDVEDKPARYAALGIPEYWRFDETGDFHGSRLAGDRLVDGQYEPIANLGSSLPAMAPIAIPATGNMKTMPISRYAHIAWSWSTPQHIHLTAYLSPGTGTSNALGSVYGFLPYRGFA